MEMDAILNILFAVVIGGLGWWLKTQREELDRIRILLNRSREEMAKVNRASNPVPDDVFVKIDAAVSLEELEAIWKDGVEKGWSDQILKHVKSRKAVLENES